MSEEKYVKMFEEFVNEKKSVRFDSLEELKNTILRKGDLYHVGDFRIIKRNNGNFYSGEKLGEEIAKDKEELIKYLEQNLPKDWNK